ncbi:SDR family NAD(P)-dependent oxidoreductase [Rhodococcoides yunnanense]|uniref:SDR family NAD(P)-dependent oxidoreductase n=1 Tax=Rhodococcoides yunnanense TaxID=278209 RepID=UPI001472817D|nr:SDR family oxidoreductase [Rhodococcus yunnanensis]
MNQLEGEVAIVTGAGRGIGRAVAIRLGAEGASVVVTARSPDQVAETVSIIEAAGGHAVSTTADIGDVDSVRALVEFTETSFGPPSILANVAGGGVPGTNGRFVDLEPEAIVRGVNINLIGAMLATRLVLPSMVAAGRGRIINVSSGAGMIGMPFIVPYGVSKTGLLRFSEQVALELEGTGVSIFTITPGNVVSALTGSMYSSRAELAADPPEGLPWLYPAGHELEESGWYPPERTAELCSFLSSGKADAVSGRFFSVHYDESEIVAQAERVVRDELYVLRVPTLEGLEASHVYGDHAGLASGQQ